VKTLATAIATLALAVPAGASPGALSVAKAIPVGKHPAGVALAAGSLWVTNDVDNSVSRVDPRAGAVTKTIRLRGANFPDPSLAVAGGGALWVVARTTGTLSRIDPSSGKLVATLKVASVVDDLLFADGSLWIASFDPYRCSGDRCFSRLTRIDPGTNAVSGAFDVYSPTGLAFGYGSLWVVNHRTAKVSRLDPRTGKRTATIDVKLPGEGLFEGPEQVAAGLGGVWVTQPDVVTRIDPRTNRVVARIRFPRNSEPATFALGPDALWVVGPKQIFRIDPATNRVVASARIGRHAGSDYRGLRGMVVDGTTLWLADGDADTVDRIDVGR
jgi:DNA-binding beta-propeller fold protein YncE